jgi:hypothetical protein
VFNYDPNADSQDIPSQWKTAIPDKVKNIKYNNQKGNFLALIGRNNQEEIRLSKKIQKWASTLGTIHILRKHILRLFGALPPLVLHVFSTENKKFFHLQVLT